MGLLSFLGAGLDFPRIPTVLNVNKQNKIKPKRNPESQHKFGQTE